MLRMVRSYLAAENGGLSIDRIVLSAGMVTFALGASSLFIAGPDTQAGQMELTIAESSTVE